MDVCVCVSSGSALSDGQWHHVEVTSDPGRLSVAVDRDGGTSAHTSPLFLIAAGSPLFFGGKTKPRPASLPTVTV